MDPAPVEIDALLERREALGLDHRDEVWQGVLHVNPPPSFRHARVSSILHRLLGPYADAAGLETVGTVGIGVKDNNRIPDLTLQRPQDAEPQWQHTAALAIEIVSPKVRVLCRARRRRGVDRGSGEADRRLARVDRWRVQGH
jgi:Uma2 family endonuclease